MSTESENIETLLSAGYKHGVVTDVEADTVPPGLDEDVIRLISAKKNEPEFMLEWRLRAYRHWLTMTPPNWSSVRYPPVDYQAISYYSSPKSRKAALIALLKVSRISLGEGSFFSI